MSMLYQAYQNQMDLTEPWRSGAASALRYLNLVPQGVSDKLFTRLGAALELISRSSLTYTRPAYGIDSVQVGNRELAVDDYLSHNINYLRDVLGVKLFGGRHIKQVHSDLGTSLIERRQCCRKQRSPGRPPVRQRRR